MANKHGKGWVTVALAGAALVIAGAWWFLSTPMTNEAPAVAVPRQSQVPGDVPPVVDAPDRLPSAAPVAPIESVESASSTVAWPVKVELELTRAAHLPKAKGLAPLGSGANARFAGRLSRGESGIVGRVQFTGGPNVGRVLDCSLNGEFGAVDLHPGLAEVHVTGPGVEAMREVRLRANALEQLNISFDLPGSVYGQVFDREAQPLAAVDVELDGQHALTDEQGMFAFPSATGGERVRIVLRKAGYATLSEVVGVAAGRKLGKEQFTYTLHPAASLAIQLGPRVGASGDSTVLIGPEVQGLNRVYPWHRISPLRMPPGSTYVLDDLPSMRLTVRVFHEGAQADPESATVFLRTGDTVRHEVRFEPAPSVTGVVVDEKGRKIEGARVVCEAPDRTAAVHQYLKRMPSETMSEIQPPAPVGAGEVRTNFDGEFQLSTWPEYGSMRYLWAQSPDGKRWGGRAISTTEPGHVQLVIQPIESGLWSVSLDFPGRHQGVPVIASIGGQPQPEVIVPARQPLVMRGLAAGTWRIRASWNGKPILPPQGVEFELDGDHTQVIALPEGAIAGQDEDTLLRAGRLPRARTD